MMQWLASNKKQQVMDKAMKKWKNQSTVIVKSKARTKRPITLEVVV